MKNCFLKNAILLMVLCLNSCEQQETLELNNFTTSDLDSHFQLTSKKKVEKSILRSFNSDNWWYDTYYDQFKTIYRYTYGGSTTLDHYYTPLNSNTIKHDNKNFIKENNNRFFLLQNSVDDSNMSILYRHYSSNLNDHILSTSYSVSSYQNEENLGLIFQEQQTGTVPLKEYYSSTRKKHLYVHRNAEIEDWLPTHDADFKYMKTIGYVFMGGTDSKKTGTNFTFIKKKTNESYISKMILQVKAYEGEQLYDLEYTVNITASKTYKVSIPNTYTVICANLKFEANENDECIIYNITKTKSNINRLRLSSFFQIRYIFTSWFKKES